MLLTFSRIKPVMTYTLPVIQMTSRLAVAMNTLPPAVRLYLWYRLRREFGFTGTACIARAVNTIERNLPSVFNPASKQYTLHWLDESILESSIAAFSCQSIV